MAPPGRVLAIGGHAHGQILTRPNHGDILFTMPPLDITAWFHDPPAEISTATPELVRYQLRQWTDGRYRRWVYVVDGMDLDEANTWIVLIFAWSRLWTKFARVGRTVPMLAMAAFYLSIDRTPG